MTIFNCFTLHKLLHLSCKFPPSKTVWNTQRCLSSPLEGCLPSIDCSDLLVCASLIRWKICEGEYIQSHTLWKSCEEPRPLCIKALFSPLCSLWSSACPYIHICIPFRLPGFLSICERSPISMWIWTQVFFFFFFNLKKYWYLTTDHCHKWCVIHVSTYL